MTIHFSYSHKQNMNNFFFSIKNKNDILKVKINKYIKDQIGPFSILEIYKSKDTKLPFLIYFNLLIYNISKKNFEFQKLFMIDFVLNFVEYSF